MTREQVITELLKHYPNMNLRTTEEFDGSKGGIWIASIEDNHCDSKGLQLFDYYIEDFHENRYVFGVLKSLHNMIKSMGWYEEWYDCGTMMLWAI